MYHLESFTYHICCRNYFYFIVILMTNVLLSHSLINKKNWTNIENIILFFIPITQDKGKDVPYHMICLTSNSLHI